MVTAALCLRAQGSRVPWLMNTCSVALPLSPRKVNLVPCLSVLQTTEGYLAKFCKNGLWCRKIGELGKSLSKP